ncbi:transposase [Planobispora takensis]|uniref:HTH psq-type domain-containing protein n=1 Tax=Planobispora takensis TaxID=1367882 RepID=A0A8J3WX47_9ACTN|nr:transposase [Planobispora takensis]GII05501.1 hypothetical protein Pta02_75090 [Planobispora takensis]
MTRRRGQFSPEFKDEAVRMVLEGERTAAAVAREFGIDASTLGSWVHRHRIVHGQDEPPVSGPERARVRELERENAELREKLAFLKKAAVTQIPRATHWPLFSSERSHGGKRLRPGRIGGKASPTADGGAVCMEPGAGHGTQWRPCATDHGGPTHGEPTR